MPFTPADQTLLLTAKGVGPKVILRLEQMGFTSLAQLAEADAREITHWISAELGATCWKNSPIALAAIKAAIHVAQTQRPVA
jgi:predicted RecB family nuclease